MLFSILNVSIFATRSGQEISIKYQGHTKYLANSSSKTKFVDLIHQPSFLASGRPTISQAFLAAYLALLSEPFWQMSFIPHRWQAAALLELWFPLLTSPRSPPCRSCVSPNNMVNIASNRDKLVWIPFASLFLSLVRVHPRSTISWAWLSLRNIHENYLKTWGPAKIKNCKSGERWRNSWGGQIWKKERLIILACSIPTLSSNLGRRYRNELPAHALYGS